MTSEMPLETHRRTQTNKTNISFLLQAAQQNIITILLGRGKGEIVSGGGDPDFLDGLSSEMIIASSVTEYPSFLC